MRVANSRLLMLPNSCVPLVASDHRSSAEIRQNQGSAPNCNLAVHKELLIFYIFEDMKPISSFVSTNYTCAIVLYGMSICPSASSASFFWGEHSGREFEPFCFCIINIKCRIKEFIKHYISAQSHISSALETIKSTYIQFSTKGLYNLLFIIYIFP